MRYGTCHFESRFDARDFYEPYEYGNYDDLVAVVEEKIRTGEIVIGPPDVPEGCRLITIQGRYHIEDES